MKLLTRDWEGRDQAVLACWGGAAVGSQHGDGARLYSSRRWGGAAAARRTPAGEGEGPLLDAAREGKAPLDAACEGEAPPLDAFKRR